MTGPASLPDFSGYDERPVYVISVAAELAGMHPQTLRGYDRIGLVTPGRSGRSRRYSARDVAILREVARLSQEEGISLPGISRILALQQELAVLRAQVEELADSLAGAGDAQAAALSAAHAAQRRDLVPVRKTGNAVVLWRRRG